VSGSSEPTIIVIRRKKGGHSGHHGGAWKVAYADFVTAMMALFIVLWLMSTSDDVKKAVAGYFNDPKGHSKQLGSAVGGIGESLTVSKGHMGELKAKLETALREMPEFEKLKDNVKMTVTGEGLRIELLETEKGMFFESGRPEPSQQGRDLLAELAKELGKLKNPILIEGHTDSRPYNSATYSNWELSTDRANQSRRFMQECGLRDNQVLQVRGFADRQLRDPAHPEDAANRRVSVIVTYGSQDEPAPPAAAMPVQPAPAAKAARNPPAHPH
jgi:chemotaxis protein MotB